MAPLSTAHPLALGTQMPSSPCSLRTRAAVVGASALALFGSVGLVAIRSEVFSSLRGTDVNVELSSTTAEKHCSWVSGWQQNDTSACLAIPDAELLGGVQTPGMDGKYTDHDGGHGQVFRVQVPDGTMDGLDGDDVWSGFVNVCRSFGVPVAFGSGVSGSQALKHFLTYPSGTLHSDKWMAEQLVGKSDCVRVVHPYWSRSSWPSQPGVSQCVMRGDPRFAGLCMPAEEGSSCWDSDGNLLDMSSSPPPEHTWTLCVRPS